ELAVEQTIATKFRNAGQTCVCANRIYVHESIIGEFAQNLADKARQIVVGNGLDDGTELGPIINEEGYKEIVNQIEDAISKGAEVLSGNTYNVSEKKKYLLYIKNVITYVHIHIAITLNVIISPI